MARADTISAWVKFETARNADNDLFYLCCLQTLSKTLNLDVVGLVAIFPQHLGIGRHERIAIDAAHELQLALRRLEIKYDRSKTVRGFAVASNAVAECADAHAFLPQQSQIDICHGHCRLE